MTPRRTQPIITTTWEETCFPQGVSGSCLSSSGPEQSHFLQHMDTVVRWVTLHCKEGVSRGEDAENKAGGMEAVSHTRMALIT
jgi:hypothetical protein